MILACSANGFAVMKGISSSMLDSPSKRFSGAIWRSASATLSCSVARIVAGKIRHDESLMLGGVDSVFAHGDDAGRRFELRQS